MLGEIRSKRKDDSDDCPSFTATKHAIVIRLTLQVSNIEHIRIAYGDDVACGALGTVERLLKTELPSVVFVSSGATGIFGACLKNIEFLEGSTVEEKCDNLLGRLCRIIPTLAMGTAAHPIHLWAEGGWQRAAGGDDCVCGASPVRFTGNPPGEGRIWIRRYREAMALASRVLACLAPTDSVPDSADGLMLYRQPVRNASRNASLPDSVLCHEVSARVGGGFGASALLSGAFPALERLGFARLVDHCIVAKAIDALAASPADVFSVRLSARSLAPDGWWREIEARLAASPAVAGRLILAVPEEALVPDTASAVGLLRRLRHLGCGIALDGFGRGAASTKQLGMLAPDIVKLDRFFLRDCANRQGVETFLSLIDLARSIGRTVVVEGVETSAQADFVREVGCVWQQGFYWGRPTPVVRRGSGAPAGTDRMWAWLKAAMASAGLAIPVRRSA